MRLRSWLNIRENIGQRGGEAVEADFGIHDAPIEVSPNQTYTLKLVRNQMAGPQTYDIETVTDGMVGGLVPSVSSVEIPGMQTEVTFNCTTGGGKNPSNVPYQNGAVRVTKRNATGMDPVNFQALWTGNS